MTAPLIEVIQKPFTIQSKRHFYCNEFLNTDRNYVDRLDTIINVFQKPLEAALEVEDGPNRHLDATEIKIIFGNLGPIYEVHKQIVRQLKNIVENNWTETACVGKVFLDNVSLKIE